MDVHLSGVLLGLTLATRAPDVYRAFVESRAFGTRVIIDAFEESGVPVTELVAAGSLVKDTFVMQVYADVLNRPLSLIASAQGPALGSAIHAAVAAGAYLDVPAAAAAMGGKRDAVFTPDPASAAVYDELYAEYVTLHDYFGRGANEVMHRLRTLRDRVLEDSASKARASKDSASKARALNDSASKDSARKVAVHDHDPATAAAVARPAPKSANCTPRW